MAAFSLRLMLSQIGQEVEIADPTLINEQYVNEAWNMMNAFIMDTIDELGIEETDERFRELFIELCYKLIYREMTTLHLLPLQEQSFKDRLGTRQKGPRKQKVE